MMGEDEDMTPYKYVLIGWTGHNWIVRFETDDLAAALRARDSYTSAILISTPLKYGEPCDTAIMHGPGHQSITECCLRGVHDEHYDHGQRFEWTDSDLTAQTYTRRKDGKVFRLASSGWE